MTLSSPTAATATTFSGSLTMSLALPFPLSYGGWRPPIELRYDQHSRGGWLGAGWSFDPPAIARDDRFGVDFTVETFVYQAAGSRRELVTSGSGVFRQLVERSFIRFRRSVSGGVIRWEAQDSSGNSFLFGSTSNSRIDDPAVPSRVYRWLLDRITDVHGHEASLVYKKINGEHHLAEVRYMEAAGLSARHVLRFVTEKRSDPVTTYEAPWPSVTSERLARIEILTTPSVASPTYLLARTIHFEYGISGRTGHSVLTRVYEVAANGLTDPGFRFSYYDATPPFSFSVRSEIPPVTAEDVGHDCTVFDGDGDGFAELACRSGSGAWTRYQLNASGTFVGSAMSNPPPVTKNDVGASVIIGHIDDDGTDDIESHVEGGNWELRRSLGGTLQTSFSGGGFAAKAPIGAQCASGDFNGDGILDTACYHQDYGERCADGNSGYVDWKVLQPISRYRDDLCKAVSSECTQPSNESAQKASERWVFLGWNCWLWFCWPSLQYQILVTAPCAKYSSVWSVAIGAPTNLAFVDWPSGPRAGGWLPGDHGSPTPVSERCIAGDFLGSGSSQLACYVMGHGWEVAKATGSDWTTTPWPGAPSISAPVRDVVAVGFWNEDNKADMLIHDPSAGWLLVASTGEGWQTQSLVGSGPPFEGSIGNRCLVGNFGGSTSGLLCEDASNQWTLWEPLAGGWHSVVVAQASPVPTPVWKACLEGDFTGDGSTDLLCRMTDGAWHLGAFAFSAIDIVARTVEPLGGSRDYGFTPASSFVNDSPLTAAVLVSIRENDGIGLNQGTALQYRGGVYRRRWRDFGGFASSIATTTYQPSGSARVTSTQYAQGDGADRFAYPAYLDGSPLKRDVSIGTTGSVTLVSTDEYIYQKVVLDEAKSLFYPVSSHTARAFGGATPEERVSTLAYDMYGNVTREEVRDASVSMETHIVETTFALNPHAWLLRLPALRRWSRARGGTLLVAREAQYFYDGLQSCSDAVSLSEPVRGDLTRVVRDRLLAPPPEIRLAYDKHGNVICRRDENGYITNFRYDASGSVLTRVEYPQSALTESFDYYGLEDPGSISLFGLLRAHTAMNGGVTAYKYDGLRRETEADLPDNSTRATAYLDWGNPGRQRVLITMIGYYSRTSVLDGWKREVQIVSSQAEGKTRAQEAKFEGVSDAVAEVSQPYFIPGAPSHWERTLHDGLGRVTEVKHPDGTAAKRAYPGWSTEFVDENQHRRLDQSNAFGDVVREEQEAPLAGGAPLVTSSTYDQFGRLESMTLPDGLTRLWRYDSLGRLVEESDSDRGRTVFLYDAAGNRTMESDAAGRRRFFSYDQLNRLVQIDYGSRKAFGSGDVVQRYDDPARMAQGKLHERLARKIHETFRYDVMGRIVAQGVELDARRYESVTTFDSLGRVVTRRFPNNTEAHYRYDNLSLMGADVDGIAVVTFSDFDPFGAPLTGRFGNGVVQGWLFDSLRHRPAGTAILGPSLTELMATSLAYDSEGNLQTAALRFAGDPQRNRWYTYDRADRLVGWEATGLSGSSARRAYAYDRRGNLLTTAGSEDTLQVLLADNGASDRIGAIAGRAARYNAAGELVELPESPAGQRLRLEYDETGRLARVRRGIAETSFMYAADGHRLKRTVRYHGSPCPLPETTDSPFPDYEVRRTALETRIVGWIGAGPLLAMVTWSDRGQDGPRTYYVHRDERSSTIGLSDHRGSLIMATEYLPYGGELPCKTCSLLDRRFLGLTEDESTGLYLMGARYYAPYLGRFLTPDPLPAVLGTTAGLNPYAYALDNPLRYVDTSGLDPVDEDKPDSPHDSGGQILGESHDREVGSGPGPTPNEAKAAATPGGEELDLVDAKRESSTKVEQTLGSVLGLKISFTTDSFGTKEVAISGAVSAFEGVTAVVNKEGIKSISFDLGAEEKHVGGGTFSLGVDFQSGKTFDVFTGMSLKGPEVMGAAIVREETVHITPGRDFFHPIDALERAFERGYQSLDNNIRELYPDPMRQMP